MINESQKKFIKILKELDHSRSTWELFKDFCQLTSSVFASPFYIDAREKAKEIYDKYEKKDIERMDQMLSILVDDLEIAYHDFIGEIFQELELGSNWKGQFFTPWHVCRMMAKIALGDVTEKLKRELFITIADPCIGAGALLIAATQELRELDINYSERVLFEAVDVDETAFYMAYLQISLCGMAARVIHGNSLSLKRFRTWYTPVFFINNWTQKLKTKKMVDAMKALLLAPLPEKKEEVLNQAFDQPAEKPKLLNIRKGSEVEQFSLFSQSDSEV